MTATDPTAPAQPATPGQALRWAAERLTKQVHALGQPVYADQVLDGLRRWADELDAAPAVYTLPPEPPETVIELWDCHGCRWGRDKPGHWLLLEQADAGEGRVWHLVIPCIVPWRALLAEQGPLSTAPPAGTGAQ